MDARIKSEHDPRGEADEGNSPRVFGFISSLGPAFFDAGLFLVKPRARPARVPHLDAKIARYTLPNRAFAP